MSHFEAFSVPGTSPLMQSPRRPDVPSFGDAGPGLQHLAQAPAGTPAILKLIHAFDVSLQGFARGRVLFICFHSTSGAGAPGHASYFKKAVRVLLYFFRVLNAGTPARRGLADFR